jgi:hypothetical protein
MNCFIVIGVCFVNRKCIKMTRKVQHPDNPIMLI